MADHSNVTVVKHPLLSDRMARIRDNNTPCEEFRRLLYQVAALMSYEACRHFETMESQVNTPLEKTAVQVLKRGIVVVPILRAGLGMIDGILSIIPEAKIGVMGLYRDETTLKPVDYYRNLPKNLENVDVLLIDPMLATGGSAVEAAHTLKKCGARRIVMMALIAAPEGVEIMEKNHPDIRIYIAALDRQLNNKGYIVPGLGDAGDRFFGT
jgi:uracil phosphoribosyltransferase